MVIATATVTFPPGDCVAGEEDGGDEAEGEEDEEENLEAGCVEDGV